MTLYGTTNKTGVMLLCCMAAAVWTWYRFLLLHDPSLAVAPLVIGGIGEFVVALVTAFKKE